MGNDGPLEPVLEFIAAQLVFVAALIHLTLGVVNWMRWVRGGFLVPQDVRWPAFVISGVAIFVGLYYASHRTERRPFYVAGIVAMAGYVLGYFGWHLTGHRPLFFVGEGAGTESVSVAWVLDHLFAGPVEFASIFVEVSAVVALAALLVITDDSGS